MTLPEHADPGSSGRSGDKKASCCRTLPEFIQIILLNLSIVNNLKINYILVSIRYFVPDLAGTFTFILQYRPEIICIMECKKKDEI